MKFNSIAMIAMAALTRATDVQVVTVGRNPVNNATGLKFWPEKVTAAVGSMVQFQFLVGNHTVTQSNFDNPCVPISQIDSTNAGIFSSFQPVAASAAAGRIPVFTITVNDTKPLWLFCSQGPHCEKGMAMVINENTAANSSRSLENYKTLSQGATAGGGSSGGSPSSGGGGGGGGGGSGSGGQTTVAPGSSITAGLPLTPTTPVAGSPVTAGASTVTISSTLLVAVGALFMLF